MTLLPGKTELGELKDPCFAVLVLGVVSLSVPRASLRIGATPVMLSDALLVLFYALFALNVLRGKLRLRWHPRELAVIGFVAALAVSLIASALPRLGGSIKLAAFAAYVFQVAAWPTVVHNLTRLKWVLAAFVAGCVLALLIGFLGLFAFYLDPHGLNKTLMCGYGSLDAEGYPRICAPFLNSNMFVNYLAVSVPLSLCACWGQVRPRVLVLGIASALLVGAWTLSNGYAGLLVGMLLVCWRHWYPPSKLRTGVLGVFALGTAGAAAVLVFASIAAQVPAGTGDTRLGSVDIAWTGASRPSVWRAAFKTFSEHPVSGLGYGRPIAFVSDPRAWVPAAKLARLHGPVPGEWLEAHNTWLNIAAQAGILGLVAFIVLLLSLWRPVWALAKAGTEPASRLAAALLAAFAGAVLFHGLFAALEEARHLWALMALASSVVLVFQLTPATADSSPPGSS